MYGLDGELADGDLTFSTRTLTPKKGGVVIPIPYSLILQARPEVDSLVEADIVEALAELRDKMILIGTGADNQPKGIINTTGINTVDYADAISWSGVCTMEKLIRDANIFAPLCWVMNGTNKVKYETTLKDDTTGYGGFLCEDDKIKNMPVFVNNALGDNEIILGAFDNVAVADFDAIQLKVDDISLAKKQAIQVIASNAFDVVIRRPKAFTVTKG
jgi:HK97 family phage major capsid protein